MERDDVISRSAAIDTVHRMREICDTDSIDDYEEMLAVALAELCPVRLETQPEIDEILNYLDTVLHPLVSPEYWDVYATLYDMISLLHFKQPQRTGMWINKPNVYGVAYCSECDFELHINDTLYCPNCGAYMVTEEEM